MLCQDLGFRHSKKNNKKPLPRVVTGYCPQDEASLGGSGLSWEGVPMPEQRDEFGLSAVRWAFLRASMGRSCRHKGLQTVLASVEHRGELAGRAGASPSLQLSCFPLC